MEIGNVVNGDFSIDSAAEMLVQPAVVGSTALRTDVGALPGTLYTLTALPSSNPANWSPVAGFFASNWIIQANDPKYQGTWDGVTPDDDALQAAIEDAASFSPRKAVMLPPKVCLRYGVHVWAKVYIFGFAYNPGNMNTVVTPYATAALTTGFMFNMATVDGVAADAGSPQLGIAWNCGIFGVFLNASPPQANISLATFADTFIAHDIHAYRHTQVIKKVSGLYIDNIEMRRITVASSFDNSKYAIELPTGGQDCMLLEELNFPTGSGSPELAISITTGGNGRINNCINGTIFLKNVYAFEVAKFHGEFSQLLLENPQNVAVRDFRSQMHNGDTYYPIDISVTSGLFYGVWNVLLENCIFLQSTAFNGLPPAEVRLHNSATMQCINCRRDVALTGSFHSPLGIRVNLHTDVPIAAWNNNSHYLTQDGYAMGPEAHGSYNQTFAADFVGANGTVSRFASGATTAMVNGTTYYYKAQYLIAPGVLFGQNQVGPEVSLAPNANNQYIGFPLSYGTCSRMGVVRMYRGTTAGVYDSYVDLPSMGVLYFVDGGSAGLVNGLSWTNRGGSTGPVEVIQAITGEFVVDPGGMFGEAQAPDQGDAVVTLGISIVDEITYCVTAALTANRSYTISSTITRIGSKIKVIRTAGSTGAFTVDVKNPAAATLKSLATSTWGIFQLCTGNVWRLIEYGAL